MRLKVTFLVMVVVMILAGCGQSQLDEPVTLKNQDDQAVTFPMEKPVLFFFITTYT
ncbi:hypothetical protein [Sediminibacillus massiliensis]|uniref:hypothetical protein n=1 Tax=Sediminibacillus massiliensis TaxID=1926277 RepID=UPI0015C3DB73|nr:hypothetical protein [Sediminibacillus massiliensis]